MDKDIENLLESWQLAEYIPIFAENKITLDTLNLLDSEVIKELIGPVGDRVKFQKNLTQWLYLTNSLEDEQPVCSTPINTPEHNETALNDLTNSIILLPSSTSIPPQSISSTPDHNNVESSASTSTSIFSFIDSPRSASNITPFKYTRLEDLLNNSLEGKGLLSLYSESGLLSSNGRRKICNIIVKHIMEKDPQERISGSTLLEYAQQITFLFHKENISTYFVPYLSNSSLCWK